MAIKKYENRERFYGNEEQKRIGQVSWSPWLNRLWQLLPTDFVTMTYPLADNITMVGGVNSIQKKGVDLSQGPKIIYLLSLNL